MCTIIRLGIVIHDLGGRRRAEGADSLAHFEGGGRRLDSASRTDVNSSRLVVVKTKDVINTFSYVKDDFNHMVVDKNTGLVYATAGNRLFELSANLQRKSVHTDGTHDNVIKVLTIDYVASTLISCGSEKQTCRIRHLNNMTESLMNQEPVVTGGIDSSTVAFIGPGLSDSYVMYFGVTYSPESEIVPAVSTRSLSADSMFKTVTDRTRVYIASLYREEFIVTYIYGFSSEGFTYFVTTQRKKLESNEFVSKLVRVCQNDEYYYSYTEVPIQCKNNKKNYNLVTAAYVGKVGSKVAEDLGITTNDDVLFAVFSESEMSNNDVPSNSSALCMYPLKHIRKTFTKNIEKCFKGVGDRGLDFISPSAPCLSTKIKIEDDFCGLELNTPLEGNEPVTTESIHEFQAELTAVITKVFEDSTIAFMGNIKGHLEKIVIDSKNSSIGYEDWRVEQGSRVIQDLAFDSSLEYLYVVTRNTISKVSLILLFVFVITTFVVTRADVLVSKFKNPGDGEFNHLVVDKNTGLVYATAGNQLFELSAELQLKTTHIEGTIDGVNKLLIIDYAASTLISCGNENQTCNTRLLNNLTEVIVSQEPVVASDAKASTVAFIGPVSSYFDLHFMYVGVTHSLDSKPLPAVSTRSLNTNSMFKTKTDRSQIYINSMARENFIVTYINGFASDGFSYFLTTQRKNLSSNEYISKLVRICDNDEYYYSYMEVPIECKSSKKNYNLMKAAYVGKVGSKLAGSLGITTNDEVLFAVFSESELSDNNKPSNSSGFCIYSLKNIRKVFTDNINKCNKGIGQRGLEFITPSQTCVSTQIAKIEENFCGLDVNTPLEGDEPVTAEPIRQFQAELTAVVVKAFKDLTFAFIGSSDGHIRRVLIESINLNAVYDNVVVEEGSPVHSDLRFDPNLEYVYAVTRNTISKIKVIPDSLTASTSVTNSKLYACDSFDSCTECVSSNFPCDWCIEGHRCTDETSVYCRNDIIVTGINHIGPSYRSGSNFCPRINAATNEILIPSGSKKRIQANVSLTTIMVLSKFLCIFEEQNNKRSVKAQLIADTVYCEHIDFDLGSEKYITANFSIAWESWDNFKPLDNPKKVQVVIYNCEKLADTRENCLNLDKKFKCNWHQDSKTCEAYE
ncbi:hypothetical protein FQR65_LT06190 [Abscondita terminalis]|nr:hypothetical protein FQR65_LT06190 [Abscondita terminalis]